MINNRTTALEGTEFGLNLHLHFFILSVRAAKAVVILRKCAGSSEPLLLTYVGSGHFWGLKILNFSILEVFRKMSIFCGMKILWIFFFLGGGGGYHKVGLYLGVISMHFMGLFFRSRYRIGDIFGCC